MRQFLIKGDKSDGKYIKKKFTIMSMVLAYQITMERENLNRHHEMKLLGLVFFSQKTMMGREPGSGDRSGVGFGAGVVAGAGAGPRTGLGALTGASVGDIPGVGTGATSGLGALAGAGAGAIPGAGAGNNPRIGFGD